MKNITICLKPETIKQFKNLATLKGYSISGWINAKMDEEIAKTKTVEKQKLLALLCKLTKEEINELYESCQNKT